MNVWWERQDDVITKTAMCDSRCADDAKVIHAVIEKGMSGRWVGAMGGMRWTKGRLGQGLRLRGSTALSGEQLRGPARLGRP